VQLSSLSQQDLYAARVLFIRSRTTSPIRAMIETAVTVRERQGLSSTANDRQLDEACPAG